MDAARRAVAAELLAASREHDAAQPDRVARYRNLEPESAELLGVLIRALATETILELGTSNGYSTIGLADAAEAVGARVSSVEIDSARIRQAREHLERAGLDAALIEGDAGAFLRESPVPIGASLRVVVKDGRP
jgi:predicted O-methyltransferase YrrM